MKERELEESGGAGVMLMCPDLEELPEKYGDRRGQTMPLSNLLRPSPSLLSFSSLDLFLGLLYCLPWLFRYACFRVFM
jgi:hypothetical protein